MSNLPFEDSAYKAPKKNMNASDQMMGDTDTPTFEQAKRGMTMHSSANRNGVAERDARVKDKLTKGGPKAKNGKHAAQQAPPTGKSATKNAVPHPPPTDVEETPINITTVDIPLVWAFDAKDQKLNPLGIDEALKHHGITGDISVLSAVGRQSDSTVHSPMMLTAVGLQEKDVPVIKGRDKQGNGYTTQIPRNSKWYDGGGDKLYERPNQFDASDFQTHMDVDIAKLKTDVTPYFGRNGELKKTHVEVHKGNNEQLYNLIMDSSNVESSFAGKDDTNPSVILSKVDHKRVVDKYLSDGGYKRANRVKPEDIKFYVHHAGTAHDGNHQDDGWTPSTMIKGMTTADRKELANPTASHRISYEVRMQVAHKKAESNDDDDDE
jgi:hypothetical protein